jgi:hypothetical protein
MVAGRRRTLQQRARLYLRRHGGDDPNSDTPYSFAWPDLRAEPMVISVPAVDPKPYYSLMLTDANTYNFG